MRIFSCFSGKRSTKRAWSARHARRASCAPHSLRACFRLPNNTKNLFGRLLSSRSCRNLRDHAVRMAVLRSVYKTEFQEFPPTPGPSSPFICSRCCWLKKELLVKSTKFSLETTSHYQPWQPLILDLLGFWNHEIARHSWEAYNDTFLPLPTYLFVHLFIYLFKCLFIILWCRNPLKNPCEVVTVVSASVTNVLSKERELRPLNQQILFNFFIFRFVE